MHLKKIVLFILIFWSSLLIIRPSPGLAADSFRIEIANDLLSVTADNVPLQTLLLELVAQGVTVKIDPTINPNVNVEFSNRPIEQALEILLRPASYSLLWESPSSHDPTSSLRLAEIQVFQTGSKDHIQRLLPQRTEVITRTSKGDLYFKDEVLLYIPSEKVLAELKIILRDYNAVLDENTGLPGVFRLLLPQNSDVFAIAQELKRKLNLEIAQPHYAYPIQTPIHYRVAHTLKTDIVPGYYTPTDINVPIAILDSGLAPDSVLDKFVFSSLDVLNPESPISDTLGHGTQMAFIASGIIKPYGTTETDNESYLPIIPIRAFDDNGYTSDLKIIAAINFARDHNARVISLSWGNGTRSEVLEKALSTANNKGLIIVASAGNEPTGKPVYPAAYPSVIGVGALGPDGKTWENSNFGNFVALYAPGFAMLPVGYKGDPGLYAGTSISAAFVASTIASYLSRNQAATPEEIKTFLHTKF